VASAISSQARVFVLVGLGLAGVFLLVIVARRIHRFGWRWGFGIRTPERVSPVSAVAFYQRLTELMARRGVERDSHLTPLEFAGTIDFGPAITITRAYNRVRFGGQPLSSAELREIDEKLKQLEGDLRREC
jgi:hypothetical protein